MDAAKPMDDQSAHLSLAALPWYVWRSDAGRWWATRTRPFDPAAEDAGAYRTVDADTQLDLARAMAHQESVAVEARVVT